MALRMAKFFYVENLKILMTRSLGYLRCCMSTHLSSPASSSWPVELPKAGIVGNSVTGVQSYWRMLDYQYSQIYCEILYRGYVFFKKQLKVI